MKEYRAYVLDFEGHVISRVDLVCSQEEIAKQRAEQLVDSNPVELLEGPRRIARFSPKQ